MVSGVHGNRKKHVGEAIAKEYNLVLIRAETELARAIKKSERLGMVAAEHMKNGELVPDEV